MPPKDKFFIMRAGPKERAMIETVAGMADITNLSKSVRLALSFAIHQSNLFKYWLDARNE